MKLREKLNRLCSGYALIDNTNNLYKNVNINCVTGIKEESVVSCKECGNCCKNDHPIISEIEAFYIIHYIVNKMKNKLNLDELNSECYAIHLSFMKAYREAGGNMDDKKLYLDKKGNNKIVFPDFFKYNCPFLRSKGCLIHPVRPITCRQYGYRINSEGTPQMCDTMFNQYDNINETTFPIAYDERNKILCSVEGVGNVDEIKQGHLFTMVCRAYLQLKSGQIEI
jgi:Fe-S-cluster containining protein